MVQQNCQEETTNSENPLFGGNYLKGVKISVENFKANKKGHNRQSQKVSLKSGETSGRLKVTLSIVSTFNLEFKSVLCAERKNPYSTEKTLTWPDQLTQIWMWCEKRVPTIVGELCQIRGQDSRNSRNWVRGLLQGMCGLVGAWQRPKQLPAYVWPEIWIGMSKAAKKQEKQDWAVEKPKLDNAGKLRGIHFIDPEDEEHQETIEKKNARKKLETLMEAATP